jgi:hypothetical protein
MKDMKDVWIERLLMDKDGHVTGVDLHDEDKGEAIFFDKGSRHFHGRFNNQEKILFKGEQKRINIQKGLDE